MSDQPVSGGDGPQTARSRSTWGPLSRVAAAAAPARFLLASLVVHAVVVFILAFWSLPTVVDLIVSKLQEADAALQPFDNNQHQSHDDGQQAWEKLADVQSIDKNVVVMRRETQPLNIPNAAERLQPTISLDVARSLPEDRVLYTAPQELTELREPRLTPRTMATPGKPIEAPDDLDEPDPLTPRAPRELPEPMPTATPEPMRDAPRDRAPVDETPPRVALRLQPVELDEPELEPVSPAAVDDAPAPREVNVEPAATEITEDSAAAIVPLRREERLPAALSRLREPARASPATAAPAPIQPVALVQPAARPLREQPETSIDEAPRPKPIAQPIERKASSPATVEIGSAEPLPAVAPAAVNQPERITERTVEVAVPRLPIRPPQIAVPTVRQVSGPHSRRDRPAIGELSDKAVDVPPTLGPIASRLDRPHAKAPAVVYAEDSVGLREMFTMRQSDIRKQFIELFGGTPQSESAVDKGLQWLAVHQDADGGWSLHAFHTNCKGKHANCSGAGSVKSRTAAVGLAMLPFLASGHTHQSGPFKETIAKAAKWLTEQQQKNGSLLAKGDQQVMYSHSIAAIAVCELYGMTRDPKLKPIAEKALDFITKSQHGGTGGWRYNPNEAADTSVVGWAMMALKSGEMAGIPPPQKAIDNVARWLARVEGNKPIGGVFGYQNASPRPAMTAEGLLCLQFMRLDRNHPRMRAGADYLLKHLPKPNQSGTSYYWYYGTQVMYHMQGSYWKQWNEKLREHLVATQIKTGPLAGTWDVRDNWERSGGRIYATSLKLLMLEVYYRHLPLYEQLDD